MIFEAIIDHFIDFGLEFEEFFSEKVRVLNIVVIHDYFLAAIQDEIVHLLSDDINSVLASLKNFEE